jgi:hypothetical protein
MGTPADTRAPLTPETTTTTQYDDIVASRYASHSVPVPSVADRAAYIKEAKASTAVLHGIIHSQMDALLKIVTELSGVTPEAADMITRAFAEKTRKIEDALEQANRTVYAASARLLETAYAKLDQTLEAYELCRDRGYGAGSILNTIPMTSDHKSIIVFGGAACMSQAELSPFYPPSTETILPLAAAPKKPRAPRKQSAKQASSTPRAAPPAAQATPPPPQPQPQGTNTEANDDETVIEGELNEAEEESMLASMMDELI